MQKTILSLLFLGLAGLAGSQAWPKSGQGSQGSGAIQSIKPFDFTAKIRSVIDQRQNRVETASILNSMPLNDQSYLVEGDLRTRCYFDFGNVHKFADLAAKGLRGAVVDPVYMRESGNGDTQAIYQNLNTLTVAFSTYEEKYNGYIILPAFSAQPGSLAADTTQLHETIHAAAFGMGRTDLDEDGRGKDAPEYISGAFFVEQFSLAKLEFNALLETKAILLNLQNEIDGVTDQTPDDFIEGRVWSSLADITIVAQNYLQAVERQHASMLLNSDHGWQYVHELMAIWGGKADWDGLLRDARSNVEALRVIRREVAAGNSDPRSSLAGSKFTSFFFKKRCLPE